MARSLKSTVFLMIVAAFLAALVLTCALIAIVDNKSWTRQEGGQAAGGDAGSTETMALFFALTQGASVPITSPTPDPPKVLPTMRARPQEYVVQPGDSLAQIASQFSVSVAAIVEANGIAQPDLLEIGQVLTIPAPQPVGTGPAFKLIPDSELVYSPPSADFDVAGFVHTHNGYLSGYKEEVEGRQMSGVKIVERIGREFSVNPRLLLAILEHQSGWVTRKAPDESSLEYPIGVLQETRRGLYRQLAWAADNLNRGFYLWRVNGVGAWVLADGSLVSIDPTINAGTAGVQHFFAELMGYGDWVEAVDREGFFTTYVSLFGDPFRYSFEPVVPRGLSQPAMQLPFEKGVRWAFTGGPHGGWGSGSAWAALDFAPPGNALGCVVSEAWIVAVADGLILRAEDGAVVQDLDNDGLEQTGWTVLYMHVETRDRVRPGTLLKAGDRIGHPSCEGGFSTGTHVHLARRYNGEWIPADQDIPFVLDGWVSYGLGNEYDGYLERNGKRIEAWEGRRPANEIRR
jgi:murein DD-endopeptidase MepM/ murein hydrolase activator NlpD